MEMLWYLHFINGDAHKWKKRKAEAFLCIPLFRLG